MTDAQQRWPALHAATHAQFMVKRAQKNHIGRGKAICWTDHENVTRAANGMQTADVDSKIFRWIAEIASDEGEIRFLSGRSARIVDGSSRNPGNRDEVPEGRTKELVDRTGKVRNFNQRQHLSECEELDSAMPRAAGNEGYIDSHGADAAAALPELAGVSSATPGPRVQSSGFGGIALGDASSSDGLGAASSAVDRWELHPGYVFQGQEWMVVERIHERPRLALITPNDTVPPCPVDPSSLPSCRARARAGAAVGGGGIPYPIGEPTELSFLNCERIIARWRKKSGARVAQDFQWAGAT